MTKYYENGRENMAEVETCNFFNTTFLEPSALEKQDGLIFWEKETIFLKNFHLFSLKIKLIREREGLLNIVLFLEMENNAEGTEVITCAPVSLTNKVDRHLG